MRRKYWIVNLRTKTYVESDAHLEEEWKKDFPHVCNENWADVVAYSVWPDDQTRNGIYFVYYLVPEGGCFLLLVDTTRHTSDDISHAKKELRGTRDVVTLRVLRLKPR